MIAVNPRDFAAIEEALRGTREPARGMRWRLTIGDEDYTSAVDASSVLTIKSESGGDDASAAPAYMVSGLVSRKVPFEMEGADISLHLVAGGVEVLRFAGVLMLPRHVFAGTNLGAASGGAFAASTELGAFTQFSSARPDAVAYSVLSLLPYDLSQLDIQPMPGPPFTRSATSGYSKHSDVTEVMEELLEESGATWVDNASGGASFFRQPTLAEGVAPVWTFEVGPDINSEEEGAFQVDRQADRFRYVVITRPRSDPSATQDPNEELARVEIPGSRAPIGTRYLIELGAEASREEGFDRAFDEADKLARRYRLRFTPKYAHPLLERGDVVAAIETGRDDLGRYRKTWATVLDSDEITLPQKSGGYGGPSEAITIERATTPTGVLSRVGLRRIEASEFYGIEGDDIWFSDQLTWVSVSGDDLVFDETGPVTVEGDDLVVSE